MTFTPPSFVCEIAFGNNPGDAAPTWTDVSTYLRSLHITRGRQYELNQMQAGTCDLVLKNLDRRFDPTYSSSPYYPYVRPMVPVRLRVPKAIPTNATLTVSGNEVTDATRTASASLGTSASGNMCDGQTVPDSSFGIRRAATNLHRRGQNDAIGSDISGAGGPSVGVPTVDATVAFPFSPNSFKITCDGTNASQGMFSSTAIGQAAAAGVIMVGSGYFKGQTGQSYAVQCEWLNTDATVTSGVTTTFNATGAVQLLIPASVAVAAGKTGDALRVRVRINGTRAENFWVGHFMLEKGQSVVAPYVATSGGATATHATGRVQAPAALITATQGWFAMRVRMGYAASAALTQNNVFFEWQDSGNERIVFDYMRNPTQQFRLARVNGGTFQSVQTATQSFNAGDFVTVICAWDSGHVKISAGGTAFVSAAAALSPTLAATLFDIGSASAGALVCDSDVLWFATGTGTLANADAATIAAIPNAPTQTNGYWSDDASALLWPASSAVTAVWQADTSTYRVATDAILFTGYVERFPQNRTGYSYAETQIQAVDGFELLTNSVLPGSGSPYPQELSGARVSRVLDAVSWSSSARSISTGQSQIIAYTFADVDFVDPLTHLQDVTTSELGNLFVSKDGGIVFLDRYTSIPTTSAAIFTDQPLVDTGDIGYSDLQKSFDKDLIFNDWRGTRSGGTTQIAQDSLSITKYADRAQSHAPLLPDDGSVANQMQSLLGAYKEPSMRVSQITVTPANNVASWLQVLSRELLDRITTREHPPGGGIPFVQDSLIQQIDLSVDKDVASAKCVYSLLQANPTSYLILDDATSGTLDSTNTLGY